MFLQSQGLADMGVRIFSDGRDPKTKEPLAVARRTARGQRKIIYRRRIQCNPQRSGAFLQKH